MDASRSPTGNHPHPARPGRKYKSRKERPCDACRRRKVCCIRNEGDDACSLCRMQKAECRYLDRPTPRKRGSANSHGQSHVPANSNPGTTSPLLVSSSKTDATSDRPVKGLVGSLVGLSSDLDPVLLRRCRTDLGVPVQQDVVICSMGADDNAPSHFILTPQARLNSRPPYYPPISLLDEAYPFHHQLLTVYFEVVHTSFPLLEPGNFTKGNKVDTPLLAAMYSLALPFCTAAHSVSPSNLESFLCQALSLERSTPRLETVEASLLLLQRQLQSHEGVVTPGLSIELGSVVAAAYETGLNVDPSSWSITPEDRSRRKRLWWATFILEKWTALGLGCPSLISEDEYTVPLLQTDDVPRSSVGRELLPEVCAQMFVAMAALSQILSSILTTFYTLRGAEHMADSNVDEVERVRAYFELQLAEFHDNHAASLPPQPGTLLDATGTLRLAYHTLEIVLFRAVLRYLPADSAAAVTVRARSKQAVTLIIELLENLRVAQLRAFWWSPISSLNLAVAGGFVFSMALSSTDEADARSWTNELVRYRRLLELQSVTFDTTKFAAARMTALSNWSSQDRMPAAGGPQHGSSEASIRDVETDRA